MTDTLRELRLSVEVWSRDANGLHDLATALGEMPKTYRLRGIEVAGHPDREAWRLVSRRGMPIVILTAILERDEPIISLRAEDRVSASLKEAEAKLDEISRVARGQAQAPDDPFPGPTGHGTEDIERIMAWYERHPESARSEAQDKLEAARRDQAARLQFTRETGDDPEDMPPTYRQVPPGLGWWRHTDGSVYVSREAFERGADPIGRGNLRRETAMSSELPGGSIGNQPWAQAPVSVTDTGPAFQPTPATEAFLSGETQERRPSSDFMGTEPTPSQREEIERQTARRIEATRRFQIEAVESLLRQQDEKAAPSGGIRPFPDRMAFAETLDRLSQAIRLMLPETGGGERYRYRQMVKGIAANCIRELERTGRLDRSDA